MPLPYRMNNMKRDAITICLNDEAYKTQLICNFFWISSTPQVQKEVLEDEVRELREKVRHFEHNNQELQTKHAQLKLLDRDKQRERQQQHQSDLAYRQQLEYHNTTLKKQNQQVRYELEVLRGEKGELFNAVGRATEDLSTREFPKISQRGNPAQRFPTAARFTFVRDRPP